MGWWEALLGERERRGFEHPVECGAADAELLRGTQLVSAIQLKDVVHVVADDSIEIQDLRGLYGIEDAWGSEGEAEIGFT